MTEDRLSRPLIVTRRSTDAVAFHVVARGEVAVYSARSPAKDSDNEDGAAVIPVDDKRGVLVVADGLGGQRSGAEAAELALKTLAECVTAPAAEDQALRTAVLDGFDRANAAVAELAVGAATTLAAVELENATITVSHSPVGYAVEAGLLDEKEAIHHEDRHLVSNIVGTPEMRIEVGRTLGLRPRDTLVLGSDGLFDNLHLEEIIEYVRKGPLPRAAEAVADACRKRMCEPQPDHPSKPDDLTFLFYRRRG
ncbi:MAG: PP2C family protein-serine/threonine phosphatase [Planctomycetota bacterium]|jgi:serine/threonine protein phosphatase PrpC